MLAVVVGLVGGVSAILTATVTIMVAGGRSAEAAILVTRWRAVKAAILLRRRPEPAAILLRGRWSAAVSTGITLAAAAPEDVERIALGATVAILDSDYR